MSLGIWWMLVFFFPSFQLLWVNCLSLSFSLSLSLSHHPPLSLFSVWSKIVFSSLLGGGIWGRRDRWYRLQKESWEVTHISFSFVAKPMPRFLLEVCTAMQAPRRTRKGEARRGGQWNKLPWADPTAEHGSDYILAAILFFPYGVSDLSCTLR